MQFNIRPFELKYRHLPAKKGFILEKDGRFSEVSPLPGRSTETIADVLEQLKAVQKGWPKRCPKGWRGRLYPSVEFGLHSLLGLSGLSCPPIASVPCALFLCGTPDEVYHASQQSHGCTIAKLKVGHWSVHEALDVIRSLPFKLRLDFNHRWDEKQVHELCSHLSPHQIEFLEDPGCIVPGFQQASDEEPSHGFPIWKPMVRGLPPPKQPLILSSSLESSIGLHQIAALMQTHQIPDHVLGIGTGLNLEQDLVQNPAVLREGRLHFPPSWELC